MNCYRHHEKPAIAICRSCTACICPECAISLEKGFVCSDECRIRTNTIDKLFNAQKANLENNSIAYFLPALSIVIGGMLVGEEALFGTPSHFVKFCLGTMLLTAGLAYAFYVVYVKKRANNLSLRSSGPPPAAAELQR